MFSVRKRGTLHLDDVLQSNPESKQLMEKCINLAFVGSPGANDSRFVPPGNAPACIYSSTVMKLQKDTILKGILQNIWKKMFSSRK